MQCGWRSQDTYWVLASNICRQCALHKDAGTSASSQGGTDDGNKLKSPQITLSITSPVVASPSITAETAHAAENHILPNAAAGAEVTPTGQGRATGIEHRGIKISSYERRRNERITENRATLDALQVPRASSLFKESQRLPIQSTQISM